MSFIQIILMCLLVVPVYTFIMAIYEKIVIKSELDSATAYVFMLISAVPIALKTSVTLVLWISK